MKLTMLETKLGTPEQGYQSTYDCSICGKQIRAGEPRYLIDPEDRHLPIGDSMAAAGYADACSLYCAELFIYHMSDK